MRSKQFATILMKVKKAWVKKQNLLFAYQYTLSTKRILKTVHHRPSLMPNNHCLSVPAWGLWVLASFLSHCRVSYRSIDLTEMNDCEVVLAGQTKSNDHTHVWMYECMNVCIWLCMCACTKKNCMFVCIQIKSIWLKKTMQAQCDARW